MVFCLTNQLESSRMSEETSAFISYFINRYTSCRESTRWRGRNYDSYILFFIIKLWLMNFSQICSITFKSGSITEIFRNNRRVDSLEIISSNTEHINTRLIHI